MGQLKDQLLSWILISSTSIRLVTEAACTLNYIQSLRLQVIAAFYEERGKTCGKWAFKLIGFFFTVVYCGTAYAILYFNGYIFYALLQIVAGFVLISGFLIPALLRVSQVNLAAGFNPLFLSRFNQNNDEYEHNDLTLDRITDNIPQQPKKRIEEDYFSEYSSKKDRSSMNELRSSRKRHYSTLVVPYLSLLGCLLFIVVLGAKLTTQIIDQVKAF